MDSYSRNPAGGGEVLLVTPGAVVKEILLVSTGNSFGNKAFGVTNEDIKYLNSLILRLLGTWGVMPG